MALLSQFKRLFRFGDWWLYKLAPALGLFLIFQGKSTENWVAGDFIRFLMVMVAISSAAMYTSFSNDLFDLESDRLAGKSNRLANWRRMRRRVVLGLLLTLGVAVVWSLPNDTSRIVYVAIWITWTLYSAPPIRTKNRKSWGVLCDAAGSHLLPTALVISISSWNWWIQPELPAIALIWSALWGIRGIIWHQLEDYNGDLKSGVHTLVTTWGKERVIKNFVAFVFPLEIMTFVALNVFIPFGVLSMACFMAFTSWKHVMIQKELRAVEPGSSILLFFDWYVVGWPLLAAVVYQPWAIPILLLAFGFSYKELAIKGHYLDFRKALVHDKAKSLRRSIQLLREHEAQHKVVVVSHESSRTGAPLIVLQILQEWRKNYGENICLVVFSLRKGEIDSDFNAVSNAFVTQLGLLEGEVNEWFSLISKDLSIVHQENPNLTALCNSCLSGYAAARFGELGIRTTCLIHEFSRRLNVGLIESNIRHSNAVVFPAHKVHASYENRLSEMSSLPEKLPSFEVIPQGVFTSFLEPSSPHEAEDIRAEMGLQPTDFWVLGVGTFDCRKAVDLFVMTANEVFLRDSQSKIHFSWLGGNRMDPFFETIVKGMLMDLGLEKRVVFSPPVADTRSHYAAADALLMCSREDPFPCVVLEAMAQETPVVLFDRGVGSTEFVEAHGGGRVHRFLDLSAAADTLIQWSDRDSEYLKLQAEAAKAVREHANFGAYAQEIWVRLYPNAQLMKVSKSGDF
ncbi:MAG: glycosyltransferase [Flavobacteriales bacterium]